MRVQLAFCEPWAEARAFSLPAVRFDRVVACRPYGFTTMLNPTQISTVAPRRMSALGCGVNRSTQHPISFYLLGFEPKDLAHTASDPKVPGFSAAAKLRKNLFVSSYTPSFPFKTEGVASTG